MELLDPTAELAGVARPRAPRLESLDAATIALLDISKPRGNVYLDAMAKLLAERGATLRRFRKPTHAKPAPIDLRAQIAQECGAVIEALAD